jgi:hypothetical protein
VAAEDEGGHVLDRNAQLVGQEVAEPRRVEHAGHADDHVGRQAAGLLQHPDHGVQRVRDADHEGVGTVLLDALAGGLHDLGVGVQEVVSAHARPARDAGGDDHHVGALDRRVGVGAGHLGVEPLDRRGLREVERLALGNALDDIEEGNVAQLLEAGQQCQSAADLPGADQRDLIACHDVPSLGLSRFSGFAANATAGREPLPRP